MLWWQRGENGDGKSAEHRGGRSGSNHMSGTEGKTKTKSGKDWDGDCVAMIAKPLALERLLTSGLVGFPLACSGNFKGFYLNRLLVYLQYVAETRHYHVENNRLTTHTSVGHC